MSGLGVRADAVCWDDPAADWLAYGAVVLRSTWDYHHRVAEFHAWIDRLEAMGARLSLDDTPGSGLTMTIRLQIADEAEP